MNSNFFNQSNKDPNQKNNTIGGGLFGSQTTLNPLVNTAQQNVFTAQSNPSSLFGNNSASTNTFNMPNTSSAPVLGQPGLNNTPGLFNQQSNAGQTQGQSVFGQTSFLNSNQPTTNTTTPLGTTNLFGTQQPTNTTNLFGMANPAQSFAGSNTAPTSNTLINSAAPATGMLGAASNPSFGSQNTAGLLGQSSFAQPSTTNTLSSNSQTGTLGSNFSNPTPFGPAQQNQSALFKPADLAVNPSNTAPAISPLSQGTSNPFQVTNNSGTQTGLTSTPASSFLNTNAFDRSGSTLGGNTAHTIGLQGQFGTEKSTGYSSDLSSTTTKQSSASLFNQALVDKNISFLQMTLNEIIQLLTRRLEENVKSFTEKAKEIFNQDERIIRSINNYKLIKNKIDEKERIITETEENWDFFEARLNEYLKDLPETSGDSLSHCLKEFERVSDKYNKAIESLKDEEDEVLCLVNENYNLINAIDNNLDILERYY